MNGTLRAAAGSRETPSGEKHGDSSGKKARVGPQRAGREDIDQQNPHPQQLTESADVIQRLTHGGETRERELSYIRSKFFSISRRVRRSMTGRPCGQTVEYAVARSSSRMCVIFSYVSG